MDRNQKLNPGKPMELPETDMHAPVEVAFAVRMKMADGQTGTLTAYAEPGQLPTRAQQLSIIAALTDPASLDAAGVPAGTRPMTKLEFTNHITKRVTGIEIPVPGNPDFVPASCEIPHAMLIHAIQGAPVPEVLAQEYDARGLLEIESRGEVMSPNIYWNADLLDALPDTILLAMYQRITAPEAT